MENGLGEFVIKFLKEKTETRKIIKCDDFFQLLNDMGLNDDNDEVINIIDYLDGNNTDINFHGAKTQNFYNRFRNIEKKIQMSKILNGTKTEVQKLIEKVDKIKVQERPDWLEMYRDDSTDEKIEESKMKVSNENTYQRITNMLMEELKEQVENEPEVTIEGILNENEIIYRENPIMGQMSGEELRDFLSNRIIPERFKENNNNN
jgi:GTP-binding protein EngB required for normal cell division